ncbi:glucokinase regulatory protein-like [Halichondria panicea]|uniref:glucokinase regulatory protein-like n=1 Tax=Halichondria panicea TaxID=6063 RepID=UPI00312BBB36
MASQHHGGGPRITELPNVLTANIDTCDALGIVRTLRQSDGQLFSGWGPYPSINDRQVLSTLDKLADKAAQLLKGNKERGENNMFVFTGCGTSGRIAWMCSRSLNRLLASLGEKECVHYLIAGGDKALIVGQELPEDDPPRGAEDLKLLTQNTDRVMLFGITCGLSAPYVAGQIDLAMKQSEWIPVLVGFNPVEMARDNKIEKWHKTCKQTFMELEQLSTTSDQAFILNPVVGPEPITGSSRMKGGSMTAILLEIVFTAALARAFALPLSQLITGAAPLLTTDKQEWIENETSTEYKLTAGQSQIATLVDIFAATYRAAYRPSDGLGQLVSVAGASLRHSDGGHLYYLGTQLLGLLGFVDSSEMVSTYGSSPHEVRGFVAGGWTTCSNKDGDLSSTGPLFQISTTDFEAGILPKLTQHDTVVWVENTGSKVIGEDKGLLSVLLEKVLASPAKCCQLVMSARSPPPCTHSDRFLCSVHVALPYYSVLNCEDLLAGFALKLILNAISTGANILKGRVFGNRMINLTVANDKLFYRSMLIIAELAGVGEEAAKIALLRGIYREDHVDKYSALPVSSHIKAASKANMVVPMGILLAARGCTVEEACRTLSEQPSLRVIIEQCKAPYRD